MKIRKLIALLAALMLLVTSVVAAIPVSAEMGGDFPWTDTSEKMLIEEILERDGFIDGIWMPWFNEGQTGHNLTGNDLMADYYNSSSSKNWDRVELDYYGADKIYREIYNLKAMGYNIMAYGGSIFGEGVIFDANGDVLGIKQEYLDNARRLLDMCREIGMPVMWNIYFHDSSMPSYYGMEGWHVICQMLGNNEIADHYAERFVRPLCEMLAEYPDVVALVSIADEPMNQVNDLGKGDHWDTKGREMYGVNQDDMIYFMQQINEVAREELPNVARTVACNSGNKTIYRDFDLDLMGHNQYTDGDTFKSVESLMTDADVILSEYNVGTRISDDTAYAEKLITFREWMMENGYKGGFQWCWTPGQYSGAYALQRNATGTAFRKTVALLRYYMDEYRAEYRGETITVDAPVLYANAGDGKVLFIPSKRATKITVQRSDDGGNTWTNLISNATQSNYVDNYLVGTYTDTTSRPSSGYCYRIIATDANGNSVTSEPNNVAGADKAYKQTYTSPTYTKGQYYITSSLTQADAKLTSFGVEKNRPLSEAVNLIENGSFESTGGQWNNAGFLQYASVVSDSTTPDGDKSLYFDTSAQSSEGWYTFTVTGLKANTEYTFSAFIKGGYLADDNKGQASIGVLDPDTGSYMFYWEYFRSYPRASRPTKQMYPTAYDNEWHIRSVTFNTGDRTSVDIALYGYSTKMWVDGMALFETTNGMKYETGESSKAITSTEYAPASGAANAVTDSGVNNASYWSDAAGYKQGFMSVASGKLTYTASSDPNGVRYTKWFDVKPGTDYYYSYTVNVTRTGSGRVSILDNAMLIPNEVVSTTFSSTGTKTVTGRISTGAYDQLGLCVTDLGGAATIDNVYLYEGDESVVLPTNPSFDGYIINGDFEIGSSNNWENLWNNNTVEIVAGRDSSFAMKGTAGGQYTQVRQKITVEPNTDYVIEVWAKNVTSTTLLVKDMNDSNLKQTGLQGSGSTWTKTTLEFNSGSNTYVHLGFMGSNAGNTWTVDDVTMYKKPVASFDGYLSNGDFEMQGQDWKFNSGTHAFVSDAHGGNYALQLTNPGTWAEGAIQTVAVEPNTKYVITWWYKATSGTGTFNLFVMDGVSFANMTAVEGKAYMNSYTGDWQQGSYTVNSGSSTTMMLKWSTEGSNPGTVLIDDMVVAKVDDTHTHTYTSTVTKQPTCGATGVRTYSCTCGDSYTQTIAATGNHDYENECDTTCGVCGATRTASHVYSGTCDQYCDVCGAAKGGLSIGAAHTYSYDCDAECDVCGFVRSGVEHYYVGKVTTEPTCNGAGVKTYTCYWGCGTSYTEAIDPKGHTAGDAADCENPQTCTACGAVLNAALGHDYVGKETTAPTCGAAGVMTYTCGNCGDSYTKSIEATGAHTYDNACDADCNGCGAIREAADHKYEYSVVASANCGYDGMGKYTCSVCGDSYTEAIRATGNHKYDNDCDTQCNVCRKYREVGDHVYVGAETQAPTCGEEGVMTYTCSSCGDSYDEPIEATGEHTYAYDCDKNCAVCGNETRPEAEHEYFNSCETVCMICYEETREASHNVIHVEAVEATCTAMGNIEYWYCDVCGAAWLDAECIQNTNLRAVKTAATGEHTYDHDCDKNCAVCGNETRPEAEHEYFNSCETVCMICYEETREASHNVIHVEAVEATCTAMGNIEYWYCDVCGAAWLDAECIQNTNLRAVKTAATGEHVYTDDFDTTCNECGAVRDVVAPDSVICFDGNSVSEDVSGLAFKFTVPAAGVAVENGCYAVYEGATLNGYKLISMGAVVTNGTSTVDIEAKKLCDLAEDSASFAVRVVNIPAEYYGTAITATPYVIVEIDGVATTIYGVAQTASFNAVLNG